MPKLVQFGGGLNTAIALHLIPPNQAPIYDNIDPVPGSLTPLAEKVVEINNAKKWGHKFTTNQTWYWSDTTLNWVEFQERLYIGNPTGVSTKIVDNIEHNLGIKGPTVNPTITATSTDTGNIFDISDPVLVAVAYNGVGDLPASTKFEYRFVNEKEDGRLSNAEEIFTVSSGSGNADNSVFISFGLINYVYAVQIFRLYLGDWHLVERILVDQTDLVNATTTSDTVYDISGGALIPVDTGGPITGKINYAYTFYNSIDGTESVPKLITPVVNCNSATVDIVGMEISSDAQVDQKKIYRIGGNLTAYTLVDTIPNGQVNYTDSIADLDLPGDLLDSETNYPPPAGGISYLTESYAMLFAAHGDRLIFTPIGKPNYWPQTYYLDFPRRITGIAKTPVGLLVFNTYETWLVTGTGPLALAQQLLSGSQGCTNGNTVVNVQGAAYWVSTDGICISQGGKVVVYTRPKLDKMDLRNSVNAVVYDSKYYVKDFQLPSELYPFGRETTWILDIEREVIYTAQYNITSLNFADDTLYGYKDGELWNLDTDGDALEMLYASPRLVGPGMSIQKVYKNFYITSEGDITIGINIGEKRVQLVTLPTAFDNYQIKIPSEDTRGLFVQFVVQGTGTVYEISWEDGNANQ